MESWLNSFNRELLMVWGLRVLYAAVILLIGRLVARAVADLLVRLLARSVSDEALLAFVRSVCRAVLIVVVFIAALDQLGVDTTSLVAVVGAAGLAVGLALKDSLQNVASGVMLIVNRPFRAGDYVEAAGKGGTVEKIGLFTTLLRTPDNCELTVPNSLITADSIINYSTRDSRRLDLVIGISYEDDIRRAKQILAELLNTDTRVLTEPAPVIAVGELGESSVDLVVRPWVAPGDYWPLRFDLLEQIKQTFDDQGITIPFPQRVLHTVSSQPAEV
ncbi:MAG: mechanosensitive ion channel protein [Desulfuromonas sp.]|nr:MAG: mechanosensitive ion channel protein [Desulfuromonas sp.]